MSVPQAPDKKPLQTVSNSGIIGQPPPEPADAPILSEMRAPQVQVVGRIDLDIYRVVTPEITTDELIITEERINHIMAGHPGDYEILAPHLQRMTAEPDFIVVSSRPNTAIVLKDVDGVLGKLVLRLHVPGDPAEYKNSILTGMVIDEQTWKRLTKLKKVLYKRE